ncbi:hypothetical protein H5410_025586 [Solanum commersonii]|uniref:Uncharacterized protein n=1 Tax=Solanum commersonii TaxID=4109 RepID=A0A9J5YYY6_SOLCO|nr:hypothetical protein H5410_025586 [Solanum commersonii]
MQIQVTVFAITDISPSKSGTKIQTTFFNKDVHAWNKSFQLNQSYYIINGKLNGAKPNSYLSA